jgi:hypothetical protein
MLGNFGFSYISLLYLFMLWIPNAMWAKRKPEGYDPSGENKILLVFERAGQMLCTASILLFSDYNPRSLEPWAAWFVASAALMILYEVNWLRYFRSKQTVIDFYRPLFGIPAPGATLPVAAFLLLGIYGKVIWLIIASAVLGIGHVGIHIQHINKLKLVEKQR